MNEIKQYGLARMREPSTWRGLVWLAVSLGVSLNPEQIESIVAAGTAIVGAMAAATKG